LADPGALDRSTNSGRLSLCRLPRTVCAPTALRRSVGLRTTPLALRRLIAVIPRALRSLVGALLTPSARRLSVIEADTVSTIKITAVSAQLPSSVAGRSLDPTICVHFVCWHNPITGCQHVNAWMISVVGFLITFLLVSSEGLNCGPNITITR